MLEAQQFSHNKIRSVRATPIKIPIIIFFLLPYLIYITMRIKGPLIRSLKKEGDHTSALKIRPVIFSLGLLNP